VLSHDLRGGSPAGDYTITLYAGVYPDTPVALATLHFIKQTQ
jgi:hypothetical protein